MWDLVCDREDEIGGFTRTGQGGLKVHFKKNKLRDALVLIAFA